MSNRLRRSVRKLCPHPKHSVLRSQPKWGSVYESCAICGAVRYEVNPGGTWWPWRRLNKWETAKRAALGLLLLGCSFETPDATLDGIADYALLTTLPEPGPRPASFECTLGNLTVWGDDPHVTSFQVEGKEPVHVRSEDEITDVHMSGVLVIVVGDLLIAGEQWVRLGNCE